MIKEESDVEQDVQPTRGKPSYVFVRTPPKRRRGWIRMMVVALIVIVLLAAGIGVLNKFGQFLQFFLPHQSATVAVAPPTITVGQIHLTNTVIYATQDFAAKEAATVTDPNVQECHILGIFDCQPVSVMETVTCNATMQAGTAYDEHPAKLVFGSGASAKTVTITVVSPGFMTLGFTGYSVV